MGINSRIEVTELKDNARCRYCSHPNTEAKNILHERTCPLRYDSAIHEQLREERMNEQYQAMLKRRGTGESSRVGGDVDEEIVVDGNMVHGGIGGAKPNKPHVNILVVGHVKSEATRDLVYKLEKENNKSSIRYDWILEKMRKTVATADYESGSESSTLRKFETDKYMCRVIVGPEHRDFMKNMISGTSHADCAVLVIDSTSDDFKACFADAVIVFNLGVKEMICCIDKINGTAPENSEKKFKSIRTKVLNFLESVGVITSKVPFIPISAMEGVNLNEWSINLDWYKGPTVVEALDQMKLL